MLVAAPHYAVCILILLKGRSHLKAGFLCVHKTLQSQLAYPTLRHCYDSKAVLWEAEGTK